MKVSLAGPSYTSRSVVAAAQTTMNLYPEAVEVPNEPTKMVLYGRPGLQVFATLSPAKIRCLWGGGGRLFAVHGNKLSEVNQAGTVTARTGTIAESSPAENPDKAWIASNGHQLLIVGGGNVYCDNGAGPAQVFFQLAGTGDTLPTGTGHTLGNVLTLDTGIPFTGAMAGGPITIAGRKHTVAIFSDSTHLIIDPPAPAPDPVGTRWTFTGANYPGGVNILSRNPDSADVFTSGMVTKTITVNGRNYTVSAFQDADHLVLSADAPAEADIRWNIAGGDPVTGVTGGCLDSYGIVNRTWPPSGPTAFAKGPIGHSGATEDHGRQFNISGLNDFTFWDPLDFGVKEGYPDYIVQVHCDHEELWLLGSETTEVWSNVGDPNFPFQRIPGAFIHAGSAAIAACTVGMSVCWLSVQNGQTVAVRAQGFQPQRISTHAQEEAWNAPGFRVRDAISYSYLDGGHLFWVINFWSEEKTWVYDATTGLWHERAAWDAGTVAFRRYQPWYHVFVPEWGEGGKHIVGDPSTGILYEMSLNFYDDAGNAIEYLRAFPHLLNEDKYQFHHRLEVYLESGQTPVGAPDLPLRIGLDWSDDRGHTFAHDRFAFAGTNGEHTTRVVWRRLGRSRDRVYRVGIEAKAKVALIDAFLEVTPGIA